MFLTVTVIAVVTGVLGCLSYCFEGYMEKIGADVKKLQVVKKKSLLEKAGYIAYEEPRDDRIGPLSACASRCL